LHQDFDCPDRLDVFLDLSEVDSLPETVQLSTVVSEMKTIMSKVRFRACAILANRDAVVGMMRVFEVMAKECFCVTCTFRVAEEAEAWLLSQQSPARPEIGPNTVNCWRRVALEIISIKGFAHNGRSGGMFRLRTDTHPLPH